MDQKFRLLLELDEKWTRAGDQYPATLVRIEMLTYGMEAGLLNEGSDADKESDEGVASRALAAAQLLREFAGEDVGSIINMTREQHLQVIQKGNPVAEEVAPRLFAMLGKESPMPKKVARHLH